MRAIRLVLARFCLPCMFLAGFTQPSLGQTDISKNPPPVTRPLEKVVSLRLEGDMQLGQAVAAIGESVGIEILIDKRGAFEAIGDLDEARFSAPNGRRKVSEHLDRLLAPEGLTLAQVGNGWVVTSEDRAFQLQMKQKLDVDWRDESLQTVLDNLASQKGLNLILDPRQAGVGKRLITLRLKDATLESVLRLAGEVADLKPVKVGNVVFLTTAAGAKTLRSDTGLTTDRGQIDPASFFENDRFTGPAPAVLPPLLPVPGPLPPAKLPNPGPAAPPPGIPPAGGGAGPGGAPFFNDRGV